MRSLHTSAFTLVELLVAIVIFSIVLIGAFEILSFINIGKLKVIERTDITKDAYYFSEKLFQEIKNGGTLDFEEYFNRKVVNATDTLSGHFSQETGYGNFGNNGILGTSTYGDGFYFCRSRNGISMGQDGCYSSGTINDLGVVGGPQRYGEYALQFMDYNANMNNDSGDENMDGNIRGDDDDEFLGVGPTVFTGGQNVREIYLTSGNKKNRTFFRWKWGQDSYALNDVCGPTTFSTGCLGTMEVLKLEGRDRGVNHNPSVFSTGSSDGIIDTWIIDKRFTDGVEVIAGSNTTNYWQPMFPDTINVSNFEVYAFPNIDKKLAWKDDALLEVNPYIIIKMTLLPSWKKRAIMKGTIPQLNFSTTINLVDYFSK